MKPIKLISKFMLVASVVLFFSCSGKAEGENQPAQVLKAYLAVKDALVKTDAKMAVDAAKQLVAVIGDSDDVLLVKISKNAKQIETSNDAKEQRTFFNDLSENMYQFVKATPDLEFPVYRQYCPMAFNNTGAYWLAAEKEINNPYFGSMMLHCGSVKEEL